MSVLLLQFLYFLLLCSQAQMLYTDKSFLKLISISSLKLYIYQIKMMQTNKVSVQVLHPGIILRKKVSNNEVLAYIFELEVQDLIMIDFEADFTGSEKITIKGVGEQIKTVLKTVQPRVRTQIATVQLHEGWKLKTVFRFLKRAISKDKQLMFIKPEIDVIATQRKQNQIIFKNEEVGLLPFEQINERLSKSKVKFLDRDFPPEQQTILGRADKSLIDDTVNHWRRPDAIFQGNSYSLFQEINYKNLQMGKLLDNAFHSVIVTLALSHQSLIQRLFLSGNYTNPNGIYQLQICKNGQWQKITIDDYLPCQPLSKPKFASSTLNEIWIQLLQKAYAKAHKKYISLYELEVSSVFNDLTGCPTIIIPTSAEDFNSVVHKSFKSGSIVVFFDIQEREFDEDIFVPFKNYAYPIRQMEEEDGKMYYKFLSHTLSIDEIGQHELSKTFRYACICKVQNWDEARIKGKFVSIDSGSKENPYNITMSRWYYSIEIHQKSEIHLCLHQEDMLVGNNSLYKKNYYVTLIVFQKGEKSVLLPMHFKKFAHNRQFQLSLSLNAGKYLIVPIINEELKKKQPPTRDDEILDIFKKLDLLMRRELKFADLQPFFKVVEEYFDAYKFENLLKEYTKQRKGIGFQAFKRMWDKNSIYWEEKAIQYYSKELLFVLSVHCKDQISVLIKSNIGTELNNRAHCQMIKKYGKKLPLKAGLQAYVNIIFLESKSSVIEYMGENIYDKKIELHLDCSEFPQYQFVPGSGKVTVELDSGQKRFIMKIIPKKKTQQKKLENKEIVKVKKFE